MVWQRGSGRTATREWQRLRREAREQLPFCCAVCGITPHGGARLELDHIVPLAEGGANEISNLQWLCSRHHSIKTRAEIRRGIERRKARRRLPERQHPGLR